MSGVTEIIKKRIQPGKTIIRQVNPVVNSINKALQKKGVNAECIVGGSFAKDTHLKGAHDVDLFVRFDYEEYKKEDISKILEKVLPFRAEKLPGSRDYFQFTRKKMTFEVVPVLKVEDHKQARNVTDMSPLHVDYVKEHVKKNPGLNDEIRLAKQFAKANKAYGAESYIQGFSGHVLDLLIIYYGSFDKFVKAAASWGDRVVIDMESHWSNPLKQLNKSKIVSPLVLVDPIQPDRNAAAALSEDKFELFRAKCRDFLDNPSQEFFKEKEIDLESLRKSLTENDEIVFFKAWPYKAKDDVMGAKLRQVYEYVFGKIKDNEWPVEEADWEFIKGKKTRSKKKDLNKEAHGTFYFVMAKDIKPFTERKGPPLTEREDVKRFISSHANTYVRGGRMYAKIERRHSKADSLVEDILGHKYVQERIKKVIFFRED